MNKAIVAAVIIAGMLAGAVFGTMQLRDTSGHAHGCIASIARGNACPAPANSISYLDFHASAFQSLSQAVMALFLMISLAALMLLIAILHSATRLRKHVLPRRFSLFDPIPRQVVLAQMKWLTLHMMRDPSSISWVLRMAGQQ